LTEFDAADPAARGVLLHREGLYSSHLSEWRKARDSGALAGLTPVSRPTRKSAEQVANTELKAPAERAERAMSDRTTVMMGSGTDHSGSDPPYDRHDHVVFATIRRPGGRCRSSARRPGRVTS